MGNDFMGSGISLPALEEVGGTLAIRRNVRMLSIDDWGLNRVGAGVYIWENDALAHIDGLGSLESVGEELHIWENTLLRSLEGLSGLEFLHDVVITRNESLIELWEPSALVSLSQVEIVNNESLCQDRVDEFYAALDAEVRSGSFFRFTADLNYGCGPCGKIRGRIRMATA